MADPLNHDIRQTGQEAERLLSALESSGDLSKSPRMPLPGQGSTIPRRWSRNLAGPWSFLLLVGLIALAVNTFDFLAHDQPIEAGDSTSEPLIYRSSCGSADSLSGEWWPVLGPANEQLLVVVRQKYCGDAYIIGTRALQVASFSDQAAATNFADRISAETQVPFRVGMPYTP